MRSERGQLISAGLERRRAAGLHVTNVRKLTVTAELRARELRRVGHTWNQVASLTGEAVRTLCRWIRDEPKGRRR